MKDSNSFLFPSLSPVLPNVLGGACPEADSGKNLMRAVYVKDHPSWWNRVSQGREGARRGYVSILIMLWEAGFSLTGTAEKPQNLVLGSALAGVGILGC